VELINGILPSEFHAVFERVLQQYADPILNSLDEVILFIGSDTTIYYANAVYTRIIGIPKEKVIGKKLRDLEPKARMIEVLETGQPLYHDYSYIESAGLDVVGHVLPVEIDEKIVGAIAIFRPVSIYPSLVPSESADKFEEFTEDEAFFGLVGKSRVFQNVLQISKKVAQTDATVLLRGETGVGKELFARAIHQLSPFANGPFLTVNMASIPDSLMESELFGYEAGAFTGASKYGKPGLFELANHGTLFLDEIGEMPPVLQAKLLRVLQEKQVTRIGGTKPIPLHVRFIAATNRNLETMLENGLFRSDLYYRISVIPIFIPPLRERENDAILLAHHFKAQLEQQYHISKIFSPRLIDWMQTYDWPGNVRELQSCVEYMFHISEGAILDLQHLPPNILTEPIGKKIKSVRHSPESDGHERSFLAKSILLKDRIEQMEKEAILQALKESKTKTEAMKKLGLSRKGFYEKLRKYKIPF
jgi:transcriptional regulator with PAS, ATPase and Fis domain